MSYKIGKIKIDRTTVADDGEQVDAPIMITGGTLDLSKYDDVTSIENWVYYGGIICTDGYQIRDRIKDELNVISWSGLTNAEKDIIIEQHLRETSKTENESNTEKVMYMMEKGYSLAQSQFILIQSYASFHAIEVKSATARANSEKLYEVIAKYLSLSDAGDLIKITHKLFDLFKTQGIRGVNDGNYGEGLFDFLESSVGTSFETTGLVQQGYILKTGTNTSFINELMDVLRYGNY